MNNNLLKKHAKSFYWASFFLSNNTLDKCSSLYNFCRTLDDIVDDDNNLSVKREIFSKFKRDFENKNFNNQIILRFDGGFLEPKGQRNLYAKLDSFRLQIR